MVQYDDWTLWSMREHGRVLTGKYAHWCHEWDDMTVDETTPEWETCTCYPRAVYERVKKEK